jgi:soluble lytic murein transglycosylase-like protein
MNVYSMSSERNYGIINHDAQDIEDLTAIFERDWAGQGVVDTGCTRLIVGPENALRQGIPPALVKAVIAAESAFDSRAVSRKGAQGLMQLMPATAASLGVADPFEPGQNVAGGTSYLKAMIDRYGDLSRAIAAYNAGPGAVDRYGGIPPYRETQAYVDRVLTYYRRYHGDFPR